jgi:hypothetical protein
VPSPTPIISLGNPSFTGIRENVIPGWDWWARDGSSGFAKPALKQADDPARTINGATLQIDAAGFLRFQVYVYQTVDAPPATVVRFRARAGAYADECPIKVGAGVDPSGGHNCDDARWDDQPEIDQGSGVVALSAPEVRVGQGGRVTVCLYAETMCPARSNAAFFDDAELTASPE